MFELAMVVVTILTGETYANVACGAMNDSKLPFIRPSSLAVNDFRPLCTKWLMSSTFTREASPLWRTWALMEGHMAATKVSKLAPEIRG